MTDKSITFIVPCYNEANRLVSAETSFIDFLTRFSKYSFKIIFVDDGSIDGTREALGNLCNKINEVSSDTATTISYEVNKGKGWALKEGIEHALTDWCLTIDVDMAARPHELMSWRENYNINLDGSDNIFIGSREKGIEDHLVKSSYLRRSIGLVFNQLLKLITGLKYRDTQCGFKLYPTAIAKKAFDNLTDYGFAHDVEVILRIENQGITINTLPLHWEEKSGSKVNLISDSWQMLKTVYKLRKKYR